MKSVRIACKLCMVIALAVFIPTNVFASLTKEQAEDVALFATTFIEKGNERRDENNYPLLVYALSNNWNTCIEIRRSGYFEQLYHVKNNNYHMKNGKYLDLGLKWCMDCGDFISYVYKTTLGFDMYLEETEDPWHIKDMYADANKYENSEYFEFIYKNVPISAIDESKLEPGDVVIRIGSRENHGLIYVGEGMQSAHASRNAIKYSKNPPILGFEVVQLNKFYKSSTIVSIIRVKDGVVEENKVVNSKITWPDTGEEEEILYDSESTTDYENIAIVDVYTCTEYYAQGLISEEEKNKFIEESKKIDEENIKVIESGERFLQIAQKEENKNIKEELFYLMIYELKRFLMPV